MFKATFQVHLEVSACLEETEGADKTELRQHQLNKCQIYHEVLFCLQLKGQKYDKSKITQSKRKHHCKYTMIKLLQTSRDATQMA